jgi:hypothetical protein
VQHYIRRSGLLTVLYDTEKRPFQERLLEEEVKVFYMLDDVQPTAAAPNAKARSGSAAPGRNGSAAPNAKPKHGSHLPVPAKHSTKPAPASPPAQPRPLPLPSYKAPPARRPTAVVAEDSGGGAAGTGLRVLRPRSAQPEREPSPATSDEDRPVTSHASARAKASAKPRASAPAHKRERGEVERTGGGGAALTTASDVAGQRATAELLQTLKTAGPAAAVRVAVLWNVPDEEGVTQPLWYPLALPPLPASLALLRV